jgi:NADH:ubiquinone reductase (non-electrogenic)
MINSAMNQSPNIVIIGSGWACKSFTNTIDKDKYNVNIVSNSDNFLYTPQLANFSVTKNIKDLETDMSKLKNIEFISDTVKDVDFDKQILITEKDKIKYDYVIFAHGASINTFNIPGVKENCLFLKTKKDADLIYKNLQTLEPNAKVAVIGCGLTGSELIGCLLDKKKFNITAIDGLSGPLQMFNKSNINKTLDLWKTNNINMKFSNFVKRIDQSTIYFKDNKVNYDLAIWCGGVKISPLSQLINKKLNLDSRRGILVNPYLNFYKNAFAMGDCADSNNLPTAQNAYQQGKYLANRFNNTFKGQQEYTYQNKGKLCYVGEKNSLFENKFISLSGKIGYVAGMFIHYFNKKFN